MTRRICECGRPSTHRSITTNRPECDMCEELYMKKLEMKVLMQVTGGKFK